MAGIGLTGVGSPVAPLVITRRPEAGVVAGGRPSRRTSVEDVVEISEEARRRASEMERVVEAYRQTALKRRAAALWARLGVR